MNYHIPKGMSHAQADAILMRDNLQHPVELVRALVPAFPPIVEIWRSRGFLVTVYQPENGAQRISVNRTAVDHKSGRWVDGITWDELQRIKREIGRGDKWAIEIYPSDRSTVDVAAMRHLWLVDEPPPFAWRKT